MLTYITPMKYLILFSLLAVACSSGDLIAPVAVEDPIDPEKVCADDGNVCTSDLMLTEGCTYPPVEGNPVCDTKDSMPGRCVRRECCPDTHCITKPTPDGVCVDKCPGGNDCHPDGYCW